MSPNVVIDSAFRTRKSHKKSRNGCEQCRIRRVKCDESKPSCSNCVRRFVVCSFIPSADSTSRSSETPVTELAENELSARKTESNNSEMSELERTPRPFMLLHSCPAPILPRFVIDTSLSKSSCQQCDDLEIQQIYYFGRPIPGKFRLPAPNLQGYASYYVPEEDKLIPFYAYEILGQEEIPEMVQDSPSAYSSASGASSASHGDSGGDSMVFGQRQAYDTAPEQRNESPPYLPLVGSGWPGTLGTGNWRV